MCLRFYNEDTKTIESTNVTDIWIAGNKDVYELELENGYKIKSTLDHKFFTSDGYLSLKDAIDLRLNERKEPTTWINNKLFYCNGILAYRDKDLLQSLMDQGLTQSEIGEKLNISYHTIRKWMRIYDIKYSKEIIGSISSRKQKGRKKGKLNRILTDDQRNKMRQARLGSKCNFWKDGISKFNIKNRTNNIRYNNWKYNLIQKLIRDGKFKCCITNEPNDLVLHHIIPVWKDSTKYMDDTNVIPIREDLHKKLHALNLETIFEDYVVSNKPLQNFFEENGAMVAPKEKTDAYSKNRNRDSKITIKGYKIKNITYIGTETVYDLTVNNPFHNFVCNGIVVHNCNEMSARYTELPGDFYIPDKWRRQDNTNKQGSIETEDSNPVVYSSSDGSNIRATDAVRSFCKQSYDLYQLLLKQGIAREMARIVLPVNVYTEIYACWDMRNLLHFISLRDDSHAQAEMQEYGKAIKQICVQLFPWTMEAYEKYKWVLK
jgi:thymidylate synthase (FAD)